MKKKKNKTAQRKPILRPARKAAKVAPAKQRRKRAAKRNLDLPRLRALLSLRKLSRIVQSDVMTDGRVPEAFNISTHRPATLGATISLPQEQLLAAFRDILSGKQPAPLKDESGAQLDATIAFQKNGTADIRVGDATFAFTYAALLNPTPARRIEYLDAYIKEHTFATVNVAALRAKVSQPGFSDDEFLSVVEILLTAQESFVQRVRSTVAARDLNSEDLLPTDVRYWDNLIAPWRGSSSLEEFLAMERSTELIALLAGNSTRALRAAALSFCAPGLVPIEEMKNVSDEARLEALEGMTSTPDHFGLVGSFEICASLDVTPEVEATGVKLLDALLDIGRLQNRCLFYAAIFVMAVGRLAEHSEMRKRPAFWRRITAAAHASLVLRAGVSENAEGVFKWTMQHFGKTFLLSVLLEMDSQPRWKPDWLTAKHLVADVVGRVEQAINKIPEAQRPKAWTDRATAARDWITAQHLQLFCILPAIGESARRNMPSEEETLFFKSAYQEFTAVPTIERLLACGAGFFTVGVTNEIVQACRILVERLQKDGLRWADDNVQFAIQVLAFVAMQSRDAQLADLVAEFCIGKINEVPEDGATLEIVCRLLECASAELDREQANKALSGRIESVAFTAPVQLLPDLCDTILRLQSLDPRLAPELGKAMAAARLGQGAI
jgi:hypothetical protein